MKFKIRFFALSVSVLLTLALLCPMLVAGAEDVMNVKASDVEAMKGETVDVVFYVDSNPGMVKIAVTEGLEILEIKNGSVMEQISVGDNILWDSATDSTETGVLLVVSVVVPENDEIDEYTVSCEVVQCYNEDLEEVSVNFATATVSVVSEVIGSESVGEAVDSETADTNEAEAETNDETVVESTPKTDAPEESVESEEDIVNENVSEGGCSSSVGGIAFVIALAGAAVAFVRKKNR